MTDRAARFHGFLVIDKPAGWTSHDVVARVRKLLGERRVGHTGTLDPAATGVLPIAIGDATKTLEQLSGASKCYLGEIAFGVETDSLDADGRVAGVQPVPEMSASEVASLLASFAGEQMQVPPMVSALKVGGQRLHDLARRGIEVERAARPITVHEIELIAWSSPVATVLIGCSAGTYIRSIAADVGRMAGCGAHLADLVRLRSGPFSLAEAWTLEELGEMDLAANWERVALHPDVALGPIGAVVLDATTLTDFRHGRLVGDSTAGDRPVRVYDARGQWIGLANGAAGVGWQPVRVIVEAA